MVLSSKEIENDQGKLNSKSIQRKSGTSLLIQGFPSSHSLSHPSSNFFCRCHISCGHDLSNWPLVQFPPPHEPIDQAEQQDKDEHRAGVIHILGRDRLLGREREENAHKNRVHDGKNVHIEPQGPHPERSVRDRLVAELAEGEDDDRDDVGYVQGEGGQGENRGQCRAGSDVDEAEQAHDHSHQHDCPDGNLVRRIHLPPRQSSGHPGSPNPLISRGSYVCEEFRKRKSLVSGKGPGQPRRGR